MNNPYENLYIYYLDAVPAQNRELHSHESFLGTWVEENICFMFFSSAADDAVDRMLCSNPGINLVDRFEMTGEQWHGDAIEPYYVEDLCIFPPWHEPDFSDKDTRKIILDPGVVFGTGRHQTTEDCLCLVHRLCTKYEIDSVLDIGTGTGLLAIGAAVLGCKRVMACDFNFLAVKTAHNNIKLNRLENRVAAFQAMGEQILSIACDLVVANIHYDIMRHIVEDPFFMRKKWFILSGLLNSEAKKILKRLERSRATIIERRCPDGIWNTILGRF
jgi:ribosomal protein L11 methyltransferase